MLLDYFLLILDLHMVYEYFYYLLGCQTFGCENQVLECRGMVLV